MLDATDELAGAYELRARTYDLLRLSPGAVAADVGCGTGRAVAELTERGAHAVGVDVSPPMIDIARDRWPTARFRVAAAESLPFADGELAGYRAEKVYHALPDPGRALAEARRVLASGARIVLLGQDWDTIVVDSATPPTTRRLVQAQADTIASPTAARGYRAMLLDAGFTDVAVEVHTGVLTEPDVAKPLLQRFATAAADTAADDWLREQQERARTDRLFVAIPIFVAAATRA